MQAARLALVEQWDARAWQEAHRRHRLNPGTDLEDWYATARAALWDAATRFDPARGFAFGTFATWYLPKWCRKLAHNEAARGMHVPANHRVTRVPVAAFGEIPSDENGDGDFAATVPGKEADPREQPPDAAEFWAAVAGVVTDERELLVLRRRVLDGRTLKEVGTELGGVSKQYVRQVQARAMARLAEQQGRFEGFLDD